MPQGWTSLLINLDYILGVGAKKNHTVLEAVGSMERHSCLSSSHVRVNDSVVSGGRDEQIHVKILRRKFLKLLRYEVTET